MNTWRTLKVGELILAGDQYSMSADLNSDDWLPCQSTIGELVKNTNQYSSIKQFRRPITVEQLPEGRLIEFEL